MPRDEWKAARDSDTARRAEADMATDDTVLTFGKFAGERLGDLPADYLVWLATKCQFSPHRDVQAVLRWIDENSDRLAIVCGTLRRRQPRKRKNAAKHKPRGRKKQVLVNESLVDGFSWDSVLWFGRYSGCKLSEVPASYLTWLPKTISNSTCERIRALSLWIAREATRKQIKTKLKREHATAT